jgi:hypothetical protein
MQDVTRGAERVRRWPRARPGKGNNRQQEVRERFRQAQAMAHYLAPNARLNIEKAVENSPLLPRDVMTMQAFARWFAVGFDDGTTWWPMPARIDVSESLDVLGTKPGDVLVRGPKYWNATAPSNLGVGGRGERLNFPNLLLEEGTADHWTLSGMALFTTRFGVTPWIGSHLIGPTGTGGGDTIQRTLDLTTQFTDAQLDSLPILTLVTLAGSGFDDPDNLITSLVPEDDAGFALAQPLQAQNYTDSPTNDKWNPVTMLAPLPVGTRALRLTFTTRLKAGSSANALFNGIFGWLEAPPA